MPSHYHNSAGPYDPYAQHEAELAGWLPADYSYPRRASALPHGSGTYHDPYTFDHSSTFEQPSQNRNPSRSVSHGSARGSVSHSHYHEACSHIMNKRRPSSIDRLGSIGNTLLSSIQSSPSESTGLTNSPQYRTPRKTCTMDPEHRKQRAKGNQLQRESWRQDFEYRARRREQRDVRKNKEYESRKRD